MNHVPENIQQIIDKVFEGKATPAEHEQLNKWYQSFSTSEAEIDVEEDEMEMSKRLHKRLRYSITDESPNLRMRSYYWKVAVLLILVSTVLWYFISPSAFNKSKPTSDIQVATITDEIKPGTNKAVLILDDGSQVILDSTENGSLAEQGNTKIIKLNNGLIRYNYDKLKQSKVVLFNTIATPKGGQYQVQLPDGTNVWLNASSSVRFPTEFTSGERKIEITGEAYLEVAHNATSPFWVKINDTEIKVLGTSFNIMAYENENFVKTTLLNGALLMQHHKSSQLLNPGNQVRLNKAGKMDMVKNADVDEAVAWKNGKFFFAGADMQSIMRQVERWYDVDVAFEADVTTHFSGQLNKFASVNELLRKLELTNEVHFVIDKRKIIVRPGARS